MNKKRMGSLGKLSDFGRTNQPQKVVQAQIETKSSQDSASENPLEKLATVNIKIAQSQQEWLSATAKTVRGNNTAPVPPNERVFPQHLISVAIDLLKESQVDWEQIKNLDDLRQVIRL